MRIKKEVKTEKNVEELRGLIEYALSFYNEKFYNYGFCSGPTYTGTVFVNSKVLGCEFKELSKKDRNTICFYVEVKSKPKTQEKKDTIFNKAIFKIVSNITDKMSTEAYRYYKHLKSKDKKDRIDIAIREIYCNRETVFYQVYDITIKELYKKNVDSALDKYSRIGDNHLNKLIDFLNCFLTDGKITEDYIINSSKEKFKELIVKGEN